MPTSRALRKSPRKSPSPKRVVAEAITPPRDSPAKRARSKSPRGSSRKPPQRLRFTEGQDDSQDESQQEIPTGKGRGSAYEPVAQHGADDAASESSRPPLVVPDDLQRSLASHSDPTVVQLGALLGSLTSGLAAKRKKTAELEARVQRQAEEARLRQAVRDYEEKGRSEFAFPLEQLQRMNMQFVEPHLVDEKMRMFFEQNIADLDQITISFSPLSKPPKTAKNKIFLRNLRDAVVSTRPRELDKFEKQYFTAQQLATDKQLVQALEDFSPVLQVLYHTCLLYTSPSPRDATLSRMPSSA